VRNGSRQQIAGSIAVVALIGWVLRRIKFRRLQNLEIYWNTDYRDPTKFFC